MLVVIKAVKKFGRSINTN